MLSHGNPRSGPGQQMPRPTVHEPPASDQIPIYVTGQPLSLFIFTSFPVHWPGRLQTEPVVIAADADDSDQEQHACPVCSHVPEGITETDEARYDCCGVPHPLV